MDSPQAPSSVLETLRTVEFRLGLKGYNVDEVDEYLEKCAVEAEAVQEQNRQMTERLRQATERIAQLEAERREAPAPIAAAAPAPAPEPMADESLQRTLLLAQKFVDQTRRESEAEAASLLAEAEERARTMVAQAEEAARQHAAEAEGRLRDEVARLESVRAHLAGDVETMARHLDAERNRLRGALSEILKWVDENVQPATSLTALRGARGDGNAPAAGAPARPATPAAGDGSTRPVGSPDVADTVAQVLDLRGHGPGGTGSE